MRAAGPKQAPPQDAARDDPVQRARRNLGYKNQWHRGNVDFDKQVRFVEPFRPQQGAAIIGAGISGLACAQGLSRHGVSATLFDTGEHSVGGRAATRTTRDASIRREWLAAASAQGLAEAGLVFDHAAQVFTATDPAFQRQVDAWVAAGAVREWLGPVGTLRPGGQFERLPEGAARLYVAEGGMRRLAQHMADKLLEAQDGAPVQLVRPMWVNRMAASQAAGGWQLFGNGKGQGTYGAVVIAHNGKCANRLVAPTGAPHVASQLMKLRLSAVWVLMVAFESAVPAPGGMEGAFVSGSPVLSWAANNTAKLNLRHPAPHEALQAWTLISSNAHGQANKVPQEKVPADVAAKVASEMLAEFQRLLGPGARLPRALFTKCQLWGAALPLNSPGLPCILDAEARVGVCGDWLLGSSLQAAVLSGWALADRLARLVATAPEQLRELSVGLDAPFKPLREAEIGEFPGVPKSAVGGDGGGAAGGAAGGDVGCGGTARRPAGGRGGGQRRGGGGGRSGQGDRQQQQEQQQKRQQRQPQAAKGQATPAAAQA